MKLLKYHTYLHGRYRCNLSQRALPDNVFDLCVFRLHLSSVPFNIKIWLNDVGIYSVPPSRVFLMDVLILSCVKSFYIILLVYKMYKLITLTIDFNNNILFRNKDNMISVIAPNLGNNINILFYFYFWLPY